MLGLGHRLQFFVLAALAMLGVALRASALPATDPALDAMKARVATAGVGERPHLCVQIAEHQLVFLLVQLTDCLSCGSC